MLYNKQNRYGIVCRVFPTFSTIFVLLLNIQFVQRAAVGDGDTDITRQQCPSDSCNAGKQLECGAVAATTELLQGGVSSLERQGLAIIL